MTERLKKIPKQLLDIWKNYTNKQKTLIISVVCVVAFALALMVFLMKRVTYSELMVCDTTAEASKVVDVLKSENIKYKFNKNTLTISVDSKSSTDAVLLLADNDISTDNISVDDLLNNSLSTTNADRTLKINMYFQEQLRDKIKKMEGVDDAEVYYIPKETSTDLLSNNTEDTSASVLLTINKKFKTTSAATIAQVVASVIGNKDTDKIKVADQYGNLLYGGSKDLYSGTASSNADYKQRLRNTFINNLYMALIKSGYNDVEIAPNLVFNMNKVTQLYTQYTVPTGSDQGLYSYSNTSTSQNSDGSASGTPGTTSNDQTTYDTTDSSSTESKTKNEEYKYLQNKKVTNTEFEVGAVESNKSSIGIVLTRVTTYTQAELQKSGALKGTTFDAYVKAHSTKKAAKVSAALITMVSKATGIAKANIQINAYQQYEFVPSSSTARSWTFYLQLAMAVLIVGLLVFVVFKGVKPVEVTELEPELSVEQLLATTKENQTIEDIEFNEVSEVRRMIEKFVDEKPDAVAQLLRNWLNEDWN